MALIQDKKAFVILTLFIFIVVILIIAFQRTRIPSTNHGVYDGDGFASGEMRLITTDGYSFLIDEYEYPNKNGLYPAHGLDPSQAERLCGDEGKRLCTSEEWELACRGQNAGPGPDRLGRFCNHIRIGRGLARSGEFTGCKSGFGLFDMVGNLWEWVKGEGGVYVAKGGSHNEGIRPISCDLRFQILPGQPKGLDLSSFGTRCCLDVQAVKGAVGAADK